MFYSQVKNAIFLKRPNRFIAQVIVDGHEETVHVKNTGRCQELLLPNSHVILEQAKNPHRKTKYSMISVYKKGFLVNIDSQAPNTVVWEGIKNHKIRELENISLLKKEVTYGHSRFDLYFETPGNKGFIEVKGVTLEKEGTVLFPDAPTERGTKHINEMIHAVKDGYLAFIIFLIQMSGSKSFTPNCAMDRNFCQALKKAAEAGVQILAYDSIVTPKEISFGYRIPVNMN